MEVIKNNDVCRLCLCENGHFIDVCESTGIRGWTAANAIMELLGFQVTAGDIYPQFVCIDCMTTLENFKLYKQKCESNKELLDRTYAIKYGAGQNENYAIERGTTSRGRPRGRPRGRGRPLEPVTEHRRRVSQHDRVWKNRENQRRHRQRVLDDQQNLAALQHEDYVPHAHFLRLQQKETPAEEVNTGITLEKDPLEYDHPIKTEIEESVDEYDETSCCEDNQVFISIKIEHENQEFDGPCVNGFNNRVDSVKEEAVDVPYEPHLDGYFEEDAPMMSGKESTSSTENNSFNAPQGNEGCYNRDTDAASLGPQIGYDGPVHPSVSVQEGHAAEHDRKCFQSITTPPLPAATTYSCEVCRLQFPRIEDLEVHFNVHGIDKQFICESCDRSFFLNDSLKQHTCDSKVRSGVRGVKKCFTCDICSKGFNYASQLQIHKMGHSGVRPYGCNVCGMKFYIKGNLKKHTLIHSGEKPFKCEQCDKTFSQKGHLESHAMSHSGVRRFKCIECPKMFVHKSNLNSHMTTHSTERPFQCGVCQKTFAQRGNLNNHMQIHSEEKPFRCNHCNKMFSSKSKLRTHMIVHSGNKPFPCDQCDKVFSQKSHLKTHAMSHTEERRHKCEQCLKSFSYKSVLKLHLMSHSGEKPHECPQCHKLFSRKCHLNVHLRSHSGDWPLKCDVCRKRFSQKSSLKKHIIMSHSN